jgi:hypothetical protein
MQILLILIYCKFRNQKCLLSRKKLLFSYNSSQNANGVILNCQSKRLLVNIDGIQSTFWILDTDYKNYLFTYQCTQVVNAQKISKG